MTGLGPALRTADDRSVADLRKWRIEKISRGRRRKNGESRVEVNEVVEGRGSREEGVKNVRPERERDRERVYV